MPEYEITFKVADQSGRIERFNSLCRYHGIKTDDVWARQSLDGVSINVTMLLHDAEKIADDFRCPDWLIELIDEASFKAVRVCTIPEVR